MTEEIYKQFQNDRFPKMLGIEIKNVSLGYAEVALTVTEEMLNFHGMAHGGVVFTLADTAFGLAANTRGPAVALQVSINYIRAAQAGTILAATAQEENITKKTGIYNIIVKNNSGETVALFRGTAYRK